MRVIRDFSKYDFALTARRPLLAPSVGPGGRGALGRWARTQREWNRSVASLE